MKDEIKEILDKLQKVANRETASRNALMEMKDKDYQLLLDYITNLQEEVKSANESITWWHNRFSALYKRLNKKYEDAVADYEEQKYIINKAIEKIKKIQENAIKYGADHDAIICQDLLNILKGE